MGNASRSPSGKPLLGCLLLLAACSEQARDPEPDPLGWSARFESIAGSPPETRGDVTSLVAPFRTESATTRMERTLLRSRQVVVLAGEPAILEALGDRIERAFEEVSRDHDLRLRPAAARTSATLVLTGQAHAAVLEGPLQAHELDRGMEATAVGRWTLGIYVHPDVPLQQLTRAQVADLFAGRIRQWAVVGGGLGEVHLVLPESGPAAYFAGRLLAPGAALGDNRILAEDPEAAARLLRSSPGAIGALPVPVAGETSGLRAVMVEGCRPTSSRWPYAPSLCLATAGSASRPAKKLASVLRSLLGG